MTPPDHPIVEQLLAPPDRIVVVGGTSVGKTTLVNHWTGRRDAVGVGGLTQATVEHRDDQRIVIDTPSLDQAPDLFGVATGCDVLVWVIDGLRPVTHSEYQAVMSLSQVSGSVLGLISRADLLSQREQPAVLQRCAQRCPGPVQLADLRHAPPHPPHVDRAVTRRRQLHDALTARAAVLQAASDALIAWRGICRDTPIAEAPSAVSHLMRQLHETSMRFDWEPPPALPVPEAIPELSGWRRALGGDAVRNRQRADAAAQWFRDGHVVLLDWLSAVGDEQAIVAELSAVRFWLVENGPTHDLAVP